MRNPNYCATVRIWMRSTPSASGIHSPGFNALISGEVEMIARLDRKALKQVEEADNVTVIRKYPTVHRAGSGYAEKPLATTLILCSR